MKQIDGLDIGCVEVEDLVFRRNRGKLGRGEEDILQRHLQGCPLCCLDGVATQRVEALLQGEVLPVVDPQMQMRLRTAVGRGVVRETWPVRGAGRRLPAYQLVLGIAAVLLLVAVLPRPAGLTAVPPVQPQLEAVPGDSQVVRHKLRLLDRQPLGQAHTGDSLLIHYSLRQVGVRDSI
ncbi:MAG: hypothetical protein GKR89_26185 [Candidatus Latescibacteria bacterium]|nr:hypothetical protein [Candidatus Latescibacterota bacterium]